MIPAWFEAHLEHTRFLERWPGFAGLLAATRVSDVGDAVAVMAVGLERPHEPGLRVHLLVHRAWLEQNAPFFEGCLLHELHHVAYHHLDDPRLHTVEHPQWMELAMELAANEDITAPLPPAFRWQDFAEFGVAAGQTTLERYTRLVAAANRGELSMFTEDELDERRPQDRRPTGEGGARVVLWPGTPKRRLLDAGRVGQHRAGHCAGGPRGIGDVLREWSRGGPGGLGRPDPEDQLLRYHRAVRSWVAQGPQGEVPRHPRGQPRSVQTIPGRIEWGPLLQRVLGERVPRPTWSRPARRFPDRRGEVPGRSRRRAEVRVLAALDTSASMRPDWIDRASAEIERLSRTARVTVREADAAVHRTYPARPVERPLGGGDTDLRVVFRDADRWDVVVCFTDGRGPWPEVEPRVPVVWALFGEVEFGCPWGTALRVT